MKVTLFHYNSVRLPLSLPKPSPPELLNTYNHQVRVQMSQASRTQQRPKTPTILPQQEQSATKSNKITNVHKALTHTHTPHPPKYHVDYQLTLLL